MEDEYPVNLRVDLSPENSLLLFPGSITITRTTVSVFKLSVENDEEPLFIGVCSVPLLSFSRRRSTVFPSTDAIILTSTSERLFINASLSAGLVTRDGGVASTRSTSTGIYATTPKDEHRIPDQLQRLDNPALWTRLRLEFPSPEGCARCVEALLSRFAKDITSRTSEHTTYQEEASPKTRSLRHSDSGASRTSLVRHSRDQALASTKSPSITAPFDSSQRMNTCRSTMQGFEASRRSSTLHQPISRPLNRPIGSRRELDSPSEIRTPRSPHQQGQSNPPARNMQIPQREVLTPCDSLDGRNTPRGMPFRSRPNNSRRELDSPSEIRTPRTSVQGSTQGSPCERPSVNRPRNEAVNYGAVNRSYDSISNGNGHRAIQRTTTATAVSTNATNLVQQGVTQPTYATSHPYGYVMPIPYSPSTPDDLTPHSMSSRSQFQLFLRNVMKLMHHRNHLMQYLHKELVHQAYIAEEIRILGGVRRRGRSSRPASMSRSVSRPTSLSARSPRRTVLSSVAEESSRLREIEDRLRSVEELHRDAERDRREVSRLRIELERKLDSAIRDSAGTHNHISPSRNISDSNDFDASIQSLNARDHNNKRADDAAQQQQQPYCGNDLAQPSYQSKMRGCDASHGSIGSGMTGRGGQLAVVPQRMPSSSAEVPSEPEYSVAILDRYIFGDEWHYLYPERESDIRFNALIDVCLALKLPRRFVTIMGVSIDQPGLRLTVEIHHDNATLPRAQLERRFANQPFCLLQRFYELRYNLASEEMLMNHALQSVRHGSRTASRGTNTRTTRRVSGIYPRGMMDEIAVFGSDGEATGDSMTEIEGRLQEQQRRADERDRRRGSELLWERERRQTALMRERALQQLGQIEQEESFRRSRITLSEAQERRDLTVRKNPGDQSAAFVKISVLEEGEQVERAQIEVGYVRQAQTLMQAHRRILAFIRLVMHEAERRTRLSEQEHEAYLGLGIMMRSQSQLQLGSASHPEVDERARRQFLITAEAKHRSNIYNNIRAFLLDAVRDEMEALIGDEKTSRVVLAADEMKERIDILCIDDGSTGNTRSCFTGLMPSVSPQAWQALLAEESAERVHIGNDELRRRHMFQREYTVVSEDMTRNEIEMKEIEEHIEVLDHILQSNRAMLELHRKERQNVLKLVNDEQYYRKGILNDEQDRWEVFMELFDSELHAVLLAEAARLSAESDLESPQRRRRVAGTPRQTKSFHYMTFAPEDMDHPPTANLAIEGILGCSINKNLEVTSIARPLPKVEEECLQFQAGDMILDVAGHSLHSLSHLREVLSNRTVQIQHEAFEEFPDLAEEELTVNPALQKYVEVLCEHHNFLVQVLRGCDIYQIIVRS